MLFECSCLDVSLFGLLCCGFCYFARVLRFGDWCVLWFGWVLLLASVLIVVAC